MRDIRAIGPYDATTPLTPKDSEWIVLKGSFEKIVAAAPHELIGPLNQASALVGMFAERQQNPHEQEEAETLLGFLESAAERMQATVAGLRAWLDITSTRFERTPVKMNHVFNMAVLYLDREITRTKTEIECAELPDAYGDTTALANLFQILLSNSMKFSKPGVPPKIEVSAEISDKDWVFSVADHGIGIDPAHCDRLFLPFKRLHGHEYPGAGMGLANARTIVDLHQGSIWVDPRPSDGACICFSLGPVP